MQGTLFSMVPTFCHQYMRADAPHPPSTTRTAAQRAAVEQGVVQAVSTIGIDDLLKQSSGDLGSVATRAREIADNTSAVSVALSRQLLWRMLGADHPMEAHRIDSKAIFSMGRSKDAYEGVSSFLEKRPPRFEMKVSRDLPPFFPWWKPRPFRE